LRCPCSRLYRACGRLLSTNVPKQSEYSLDTPLARTASFSPSFYTLSPVTFLLLLNFLTFPRTRLRSFAPHAHRPRAVLNARSHPPPRDIRHIPSELFARALPRVPLRSFTLTLRGRVGVCDGFFLFLLWVFAFWGWGFRLVVFGGGFSFVYRFAGGARCVVRLFFIFVILS